MAFNDAESVFSIKPVAGYEATVAQHFTKKNIYHAGSWQGCSCGFANDIDFEDSDLVAKNTSSVQALLDYIAAALFEENTVEFYTCWAGNQWQKPQERREENFDKFKAAGFELEEDVLLTFIRQ